MDGSEYGSGSVNPLDTFREEQRKRIPAPPMMIPYGSTGSGHAGNDTSKERQVREDAAGLTVQRQQAALDAVTESGAKGITSGELENLLGIGHGQASSALSHLHRAGRVKRIKERRMKQELYVLQGYVYGRPESPYNPRPQRKHPKFHSDRTVLEAMKVADIAPTRYESIRKFLEALP
jgi:ribosomal protein S25